jgi:hypothetical protein
MVVTVKLILQLPDQQGWAVFNFKTENEMKKVYIPTLLCVLSIIHLTTAQIPLNLKISFEKDTLDLISPWAFRLEVLNTSDSNIFVYPLLVTDGGIVHFGEIFIYAKNESDTVWNRTKIIENRFHHKEQGGSFYINLPPNKKLENSFFCRPPLEEIKPGKLEVRATCISQYGRAVSNSVHLYINEYKGDDLLVFQYLNKLKRPDFVLYPVLSAARTDSSYIMHNSGQSEQ